MDLAIRGVPVELGAFSYRLNRTIIRPPALTDSTATASHSTWPRRVSPKASRAFRPGSDPVSSPSSRSVADTTSVFRGATTWTTLRPGGPSWGSRTWRSCVWGVMRQSGRRAAGAACRQQFRRVRYDQAHIDGEFISSRLPCVERLDRPAPIARAGRWATEPARSAGWRAPARSTPRPDPLPSIRPSKRPAIPQGRMRRARARDECTMRPRTS